MEETPICASVERDLEIDVAELTGGVATTPSAAPAPAKTQTEAEAEAQANVAQ